MNFRRNERPERPSFLEIDRGHSHGGSVAWIGHAAFDPLGEIGDDRVRQFPLGRHLLELGIVPDRPEQQAFLEIARNDRRSTVAARADTGARIELQSALELAFLGRLGRVALVTVFDQHWANLRLEEVSSLVGADHRCGENQD